MALGLQEIMQLCTLCSSLTVFEFFSFDGTGLCCWYSSHFSDDRITLPSPNSYNTFVELQHVLGPSPRSPAGVSTKMVKLALPLPLSPPLPLCLSIQFSSVQLLSRV